MSSKKLEVPKKEGWYILLPIFMKYGFKLGKPIADNFLLYAEKIEILLPRKNNIPRIQIEYFIKKSKLGRNKFLKCLDMVKKEEKLRVNKSRHAKSEPTIP